MSKSLIAIVTIIVIAGVGVWAFTGSDEPASKVENTSENQNQELVSAVPAPGSEGVDEAVVNGQDETISAVVTYVDRRFDPEQIGPITPGSTVKFFNESSQEVWIASDNHPTHTVLPGFDSEESISPGEEYVFTFENAGNWQYHNHLNPSEVGSIQVSQE